MKEGVNQQPVTAEEWGYYLDELASRPEVGTPEHKAVNDYVKLLRLYSGSDESRIGWLSKIGKENQISIESLTRIREQRIALLEHAIDQNCASSPEYAKANTAIEIGFVEFIGALEEDARVKFETESEQMEYVKKGFDKIMDAIGESLFMSQNP